jgi:hypothetical protein
MDDPSSTTVGWPSSPAADPIDSRTALDDGREAMRSFLERRPGVYPPRR